MSSVVHIIDIGNSSCSLLLIISICPQQFMSDRKVDEEIGTTSRFVADPNDLLPHIMTFGKGKYVTKLLQYLTINMILVFIIVNTLE